MEWRHITNFSTKGSERSVLFILIITSTLAFIPPQQSFAVVDFGSAITLEGTATVARNPQIAVAGSLVWVVWAEDTGMNTKIMMKVSTDGGTTFGSAQELSAASPAVSFACITPFADFDCRGFPQVAAVGSSAYVVWQDDDDTVDDGGDGVVFGDGDIYYRKITHTGGGSFTFSPALAKS